MKVRDPHAVLVQLVKRYPTQAAAAAALGISTPYLFDLLQGNRSFSERMLAKLGLRRVAVEEKAS